MCVALAPILAVASIASTVIGTTMTVMGAIQQGKAQKDQYDYQAEMNNYNANIAGKQADNALERGQATIEEQKREQLRLRGEGRSNYASGGVVLGTGSALDWEKDLDIQSAYDQSKTGYNANMEAWGFRTQQGNLVSQAQNAQLSGRNAYRAGVTSGMGSLISGIGSTAMSFSPLAESFGTGSPQATYKATSGGYGYGIGSSFNSGSSWYNPMSWGR